MRCIKAPFSAFTNGVELAVLGGSDFSQNLTNLNLFESDSMIARVEVVTTQQFLHLPSAYFCGREHISAGKAALNECHIGL